MNLQKMYEEAVKQDPDVIIGIIIDKVFYIYFGDVVTNMITGEKQKISVSEFEKKYIYDSSSQRIKILFTLTDELLDYYNSGKWKKDKKKKEVNNLEKKYLDFIQSQNFIHN